MHMHINKTGKNNRIIQIINNIIAANTYIGRNFFNNTVGNGYVRLAEFMDISVFVYLSHKCSPVKNAHAEKAWA